jgi:uncharacterized protein
MIRMLMSICFVLFSCSNTYSQKDTQRVETIIAGTRHHLEYIGWTNDYEHIFTREQVLTLDSIIGDFHKQTNIEIAIVTLDSSYVTGVDFDDYITSLGNQWGVGKKVKNNGVIIGISAGLKKITIRNGFGIEQKLSDSETKNIIDKMMIPKFREADYYRGTRQGLSAIMAILK